MKALALNRMNKRELCLEILDKMKSDVPTDLYTLQSMAFCYKDTRKCNCSNILSINYIPERPTCIPSLQMLPVY